MFTRSAQGFIYRVIHLHAPAGCQNHAAAFGNGSNRRLRSKSQTPVPDAETGPKPPATIKITQRIGLYDYTAEYKRGELKWCMTDKHEDPAQSEDDSATAKRSILRWIQRRYRIQKNRVRHSLAALFLPVGYPNSVKDNYLQFSSLATVSMFFMNTCTTVGSTFLLYAAGLGRAESAATASAINWIVKDGIGQAGTLVTARLFSHDFDLNTRSWYICANVLACLAACAEIMTNSYHPAWFIPIASVANTLKGISGLASSSSRAALHVSFARGENIADITAKGHSQYIFSYLSGTVAGIIVAGSFDKGDWMSAVQASLVLTVLTGATSYIAIRTVPLSALNSSRIQLLLDHYVSMNAAIANPAKIGIVRLPYPSELCAVDPVAPSWALPWSSGFSPSIEVNSSIRDLLPGTVKDSPEKLRMLVAVHAGAKHFLMRDGRARSSKLHILLREDASAEDAIMAMLHAILVRREIKRHEKDVLSLDEDIRIVAKELKRSTRHRTALIESLKSANWNLARVAIEGDCSRGRWD